MAAGTLAALLGASAVSSAASMYNNQQNIKYAQEANDVQVGLANTAHQREVRDLEAAGLNPILSASGNGASVPQLKTPSLESIDGHITNSAGSISRAINGMVDAEVKMAQADADVAKVQSKWAPVVEKAAAMESASNSALQILENDARMLALTGVLDIKSDSPYILDESGSFDTLVEQIKNEIATGRYNASTTRAVLKDLLEGATSAADAYGAYQRGKFTGKTRIENVNRIRSGNHEVIRRSSGYMK